MPRFLIAPFNSGLVKNTKPWLLPEDAFQQLNNMYVFRGRIRKRFGTYYISDGSSTNLNQLTSRLRLSIATIIASPSPAINITGTTAANPVKIGAMFSAGNTILTVYQQGAGVATLSTGGGITATIDTTVTPNTITVTGAPNPTTLYYYPANPVMGFGIYETNNINNDTTVAFDTQFAYTYSNGWERLGTASWTGGDADFFWTATYRGITDDIQAFFVTNFVAADGIKFWVGSTSTWATLNPTLNTSGDTLETARIVIPFGKRLLALNTIEKVGGANLQFGNRCRFSQIGDPVTNATSWLNAAGRGGFVDATTSEQIISAQIFKNRLIVFFERSTWELVRTGNQVQPFIWQKINTELGVESTFSLVPFDKALIGVGNVGIHSCNGSYVERIDEKIPDEVFKIHNANDGIKRIHGIRDYFTEMVYWTFPDSKTQDKYPKKVLAYNYNNGSWALFDDSITAFGYLQNQASSTTWQATSETWQEADYIWNSAIFQTQFLNTVAGNQQGYTFILREGLQESGLTRNAGVLQVTNVNTTTNTFTVIDHNLIPGDYVAVENLNGITITRADGSTTYIKIFQVDSTPSTDTIILEDISMTGTYTGGGTLARVSEPEIISKEYNFFVKEGVNLEVTNVDFYVDKTTNGEVSVDYYASSSDAVLGTQVLETKPYDPTYAPLEQSQERLWHRIYLDSEGNTYSIRLYLNNEQMINENIAWSDITIHAIMFDANKTSARLQ